MGQPVDDDCDKHTARKEDSKETQEAGNASTESRSRRSGAARSIKSSAAPCRPWLCTTQAPHNP